MNKNQFLNRLKIHLSPLSNEEVQDIIRDQEEYINDAIATGRREEDIILSLGDPSMLAQTLLVETKIQTARNAENLNKKLVSIFCATLAFITLAPLNFIFLLIPFSISIFLLALSWFVSLAILLGALLAIIIFFLKGIIIPVGIITHVSSFFFLLGCVGLGVIVIVLCTKITRFFVATMLSYLNWNLIYIKSKITKGDSHENK